MGLHMRLARIEEELLKIAKTYDYADINFTTDNVGRDHIRLVVIAFAPGENSVGIPDAQDSFVYDLRTQHEQDGHGMPTGYAVELLGQLDTNHTGTVESITKHLRPIEDDEIRQCALALGNRAAGLLFNNDYFA